MGGFQPGNMRRSARLVAWGYLVSLDGGANCVTETPDDLSGRLDRLDDRNTLPRLPVVFRARLVERGTLELPEGAEGVGGAHEVLGAPVAQHPPGDGARGEAHTFDVGRADHGDGNTSDSLAQHDVVLPGGIC